MKRGLRRSGVAVAVPAVALAALGLTGADSPRAHAAGDVFGGSVSISSVLTGQAVDIAAGSRASGAAVVQMPTSSAASQRWNVVAVTGAPGYAYLRNAGSGLCLDVPAASATAGTSLIQWTCHYRDNQLWQLRKNAAGDHVLVNKGSAQALDVPAGTGASGARLVQWHVHGRANQQWRIRLAVASTPVPTSTPKPTSTPSPTVSLPSTSMPKGDLPGWRQVWAEDFSTNAAKGQVRSAYAGRLSLYDEGTRDTSHNAIYDNAGTLSAANGMLNIHLHTKDDVARGAAFVAGNWATQTYGRYQVRFRSDSVSGFGQAFLLWPGSNVWNDGEVDFPEGSLTGVLNGYSHCAGPNPERNCLAVSTTARYPEWHTATIEWTPGRVTFFLDGKQIGTTTDGVPNKPMR